MEEKLRHNEERQSKFKEQQEARIQENKKKLEKRAAEIEVIQVASPPTHSPASEQKARGRPPREHPRPDKSRRTTQDEIRRVEGGGS